MSCKSYRDSLRQKYICETEMTNSGAFMKVLQRNEAGPENNDGECWAPELAGHSVPADDYHTDRWTPGLPTLPNFLVKVKIPNTYLNLSMST